MKERIERVGLFTLLGAAALMLPPQSTLILGVGLMVACLTLRFFHHGRSQGAVSVHSQQQ